jgi:hypothetical protein
VFVFDTRTAPGGTECSYSIRGQRQVALNGAIRYEETINWYNKD